MMSCALAVVVSVGAAAPVNLYALFQESVREPVPSWIIRSETYRPAGTLVAAAIVRFPPNVTFATWAAEQSQLIVAPSVRVASAK